MTLIAALITAKFAVLVSDRRITWTDENGEVVAQEDSDVKTFVFGGWALVGFTGLARIQGLRMEAWLVEVLANAEPGDHPPVLLSAIQEAFESGEVEDMPHAFLGVGYGALGDGPERPTVWWVANAFDDRGVFDPSAPIVPFEQSTVQIEPGTIRFETIGWRTDPGEVEAAKAKIVDVLTKDDRDARGVADVLVELIQATALHSNGCVGSSVLVSILPRPDAANPQPVDAFGVTRDFIGRGSEFEYMPALIRREIPIWGITIATGDAADTLFGSTPPDGYAKDN